MKITNSIGMEKDEELQYSSMPKASVRYLSKAEFPPTPFYCMTSGSRPSSPELMVKRSEFIRKVLVQIHKFSKFDVEGLLFFQTKLRASVIKCTEICRNCDHPSTKWFRI